jgi:hypothetical protein
VKWHKRLILGVCSTVMLLMPAAAATAAPRMYVGFQDDPSFRWKDDRTAVLDLAQKANASIVRTTVYWNLVAPTRPANAANPFDPAYRFDDVDELVRNAQYRGMEVMLTIWGTPKWANGGKGTNHVPTHMSDLTAFAKALSSRYSGRNAGIPYVRYYTVWNESNLGQFLSPQFNAAGKPVAPSLYASLYRAAYAGIKSGSPKALIGLGETSARGRDKPLHSKTQQETESPGRFAQLLSLQRPKLKFDAWSQHPYPTTLTAKPTQKVRWPNVAMSNLSTLEANLDKWFGKKNIPIWITEYGYQTRPQNPGGVTYAQQASYAKQALTIAENDPNVQMFIWFILRDDPSSVWKSGLISPTGATKPAYKTFSAMAKLLDARNPIVTVKGGKANPILRVPALELLARSGPGAPVGVTYSVYQTKLIASGQPQSVLGTDGWVSFPVQFTPQKGQSYRVYADLNDANGNLLERVIDINAT